MRRPVSTFGAGQLSGNLGDALRFRAAGAMDVTSGGVLTRGAWVCAQLTIDVADVGGSAEASFGPTMLSASDADTLPDMGYSRIFVGLATDNAAHTVWFDDLYIGTERPGCF